MVSRICIALTAALLCLPAWAVGAGDVAPEWVGVDAQGREVVFPQVLGGGPAVMVFWATWCPYCKAFMPHLESILEDYADQGVKVLAINTREEPGGEPKAYLEGLGFPLVGILDGDSIAADYDVHFIPGLMVVDATGTVSWRRESTDLPPGRTLSEQWSTEVRAALDEALRAAP